MARRHVGTVFSGVIALCAILLFAPEARSQSIGSGRIAKKKFTISGTIGLSGVSLRVSPGNQAVTTDESGAYSLEVEYGWTGKIMPTKLGYEFEPKERSYPKVIANMEEQDYTATLQMYTISGSVGEAGVRLNGFPTEVISDPNGRYKAIVDYGWSGEVTPEKMGFGFNPISRSYKQVTKSIANDNYKAVEVTYTISGSVGAPDVVMQGLPGNPKSGPDGRYSVTVRYGQTKLKVVPTKEGYEFIPPEMEYDMVLSNLENQDYQFTVLQYTISGSAGMPGVLMKGFPTEVTTDQDGFYTATVNHGWSGKVTAEKPGFSFVPAARPYIKVVANAEAQDYTGTEVLLTIEGTLTGVGEVELVGFPQGPVTTDAKGFYSQKVPYGFSATITPEKEGYKFQPAERPYDSIKVDQRKQDFKGEKITYEISGNVGEGGVALQGFTTPVTSKSDGTYSVKVPYNWQGTLTPKKAGFTFQPPEQAYPGVLADQTNQDYTAAINQYGISGKVLDKTGAPIVDVQIVADGQAEAGLTDDEGVFEILVNHGWKGKITPQKAGYTFSPAVKSFDVPVTSPLGNQSIVGEVKMLTITNVLKTDNGEPLADVVVTAVPGDYTARTDLKGKYAIQVPYGWAGELSFFKEEWDIQFTAPYPDPVTEDIDETAPKKSKPQPKPAETTRPPSKPQETSLAPKVQDPAPTQSKPQDVTQPKPQDAVQPKPQGGGTPPAGATPEVTPSNAISPAKMEYLRRYVQAKERLNQLESQLSQLDSAGLSEITALTQEIGRLEVLIKGGQLPAGEQPVVRPNLEPLVLGGDATPRLLSVLAELSRLTTVPIGVDLTVKDEPVAMGVASVQGMPIELALQRILDGVKVAGQNKYMFKKDAAGNYLVFKPLTNSFPGTDILMALDALASDAEVPIIPDPNVGGRASASFTNRPLEEALEMVLAATPYVFKQKGTYYVVGDRSPDSFSFPEISVTRHLNLNHKTPARVKDMLPKVYKQYVEAEAASTTDPNDQGHLITITAPVEINQMIQKMIREWDKTPRQVLLDARVVAMERGNLLNLGVEWTMPTLQAGQFYNGDSWTKGVGLGYTADSVFTNSLMAKLNALEATSQADIVTNPQLIAQDGGQAQLRSIREEWFMMSDNQTDAYGYSRAELQKIESGTTLTITPRIGDSNDITLELAVEVSSSVAKGRDNDLPIVTRRQAKNKVTLKNGGTVAVAGLTENRTTSTDQRVPVLGSIPLVGRLFRSNNDDKETREIAVFVTATLIPERTEARPGAAGTPTITNQAQPAGPEFKQDLANALKRTQ